jgi:hypothetical protein
MTVARSAVAICGFWSALLFCANESFAAEFKAQISLENNKTIGLKKAGFACVPSGWLHVHDFVGDDTALIDVFEKEFERQAVDKDSLKGLSINLQDAEVNLCNRGYGIWGTGDTKSLSGKAKFTFSSKRTLSDGNIRVGSQIVNIELDKKSALAPEQIFAAIVKKYVSTSFRDN